MFIKREAGALCLDCAGLGHLEFLPAGCAALTRRTVKASRQPVIVMRHIGIWASSMRRSFRGSPYERQGVLAERTAIERAARETLADVDVLGRDEIAAAIREQFPGCPSDRAEAIAVYTAVRFGGRGRRRVGAREVDADAVRLAVEASVLHLDTEYDDLLASGVGREAAHDEVGARVENVLNAWRTGVTVLDA